MILAIDTSGPLNQIIVCYKEHFYSSRWQNQQSGTEKILSRIDKLFRKNSLTISQLKKIVIYPGPGSYTGLRVGFSVAQALSEAAKIDLYVAESKDLKKEIKKLKENMLLIKNPKPNYSFS